MLYFQDNEYVSYQARPENLIINNGRLSIWPTILKDNDYIQTGELNMTEMLVLFSCSNNSLISHSFLITNSCGCRGTKLGECYGKAMTFNILQPVVSASVRSKFSFRYGKVQIRAKLPKGNWLYPCEPEFFTITAYHKITFYCFYFITIFFSAQS